MDDLIRQLSSLRKSKKYIKAPFEFNQHIAQLMHEMQTRHETNQEVKKEEVGVEELDEHAGNKWSKAAFVIDNLTVLWEGLVDDNLGAIKQLSRDLRSKQFNRRPEQEQAADADSDDDLDNNFEVTDADIERACSKHVDRENVTKKAEKKKQSLLADCFTDPLFERSK